jgi:hypothetical protein
VLERTRAAIGLRLRRFVGSGPPAEPSVPDDAQRDYARLVLALLDECEVLHQRWLEQLEELPRSDRLANSVAVYHWHLNGVRERVVQLDPPFDLLAAHEALISALEATCRGTRLLSGGYRFHSVRRICDGGLVLDQARTQAHAVRDSLVRLLNPPASTPTEAVTPLI